MEQVFESPRVNMPKARLSKPLAIFCKWIEGNIRQGEVAMVHTDGAQIKSRSD